MKILCGWCDQPTSGDHCAACGHVDPARPWRQRGIEPPVVADGANGRPALDGADVRRRYAAAADAIRSSGFAPTVARLAAQLDVSERTVRDWRSRFDLR